MTTDTLAKPTAWAHLPNAAHIDRVLADVRARPQAWTAAWDAAHNAAHNAAWDAAWNAAWAAARLAAWNAAWAAARVAAWTATRDAVAALIAWDDCAYILDMPPDACRVLAELGNHAAVLLYPATVVLGSDVTT